MEPKKRTTHDEMTTPFSSIQVQNKEMAFHLWEKMTRNDRAIGRRRWGQLGQLVKGSFTTEPQQPNQT